MINLARKKELKELLSRQLLEKLKVSINLVELECILRTQRDRNLTDIMTEMRAVKGVTIVSITDPSRNIDEHQQITGIKIKYEPYTSKKNEYIKFLKREISNIPGVSSFRILNLKDISR